jgi:hypothetical protein
MVPVWEKRWKVSEIMYLMECENLLKENQPPCSPPLGTIDCIDNSWSELIGWLDGGLWSIELPHPSYLQSLIFSAICLR